MDDQSSSATIEPPRITQLVASDGSNIGEGGSNIYAEVTLKGTAEASRVVEAFDNDNFIALASVASGVWAIDLRGLSTGLHIFIVRYYDGQMSSNEWRYTVTVAAPTISHVNTGHIGTVRVSNGGSTEFKYLDINGTGTYIGQPKLELYDNGVLTSYNVISFDDGRWAATASCLSPGQHAFTVKARGDYPPSVPWRVYISSTPLFARITRVSPNSVTGGGWNVFGESNYLSAQGISLFKNSQYVRDSGRQSSYGYFSVDGAQVGDPPFTIVLKDTLSCCESPPYTVNP